jgi:hypothetical protein
MAVMAIRCDHGVASVFAAWEGALLVIPANKIMQAKLL